MLLQTFKIAFRFNQDFKKKQLIWLIFLLSKLGIIFGSSVLLIGLSVTNGFEKELKNKILKFIPHGSINYTNQPYLNWKNDLNNIKKTKGIISVTPYISFTTILENKNKIKLVQIIGSDSLPKKIINNQKLNIKKIKLNEKEIILGKEIANSLKISNGNNLIIRIPHCPDNNINIQKINKTTFKVIKIFQFNSILDNKIAYISLSSAQKYFKHNSTITGFQIKVNNIFSAEKILNNAKKKINQFINIECWKNIYGNLYENTKMMRITIYLSMILVLIVSSFSIISILMITLKNKIIDIAILKTIGAENKFIFFIFFWYGMICGIPGCLIGTFIGIIISSNLTKIFNFIEYIFKEKLLFSDIYFIDFIPSFLSIKDIFFVMLITIFLTLLMSLYPAKKAIKIKIIKNLKN